MCGVVVQLVKNTKFVKCLLYFIRSNDRNDRDIKKTNIYNTYLTKGGTKKNKSRIKSSQFSIVLLERLTIYEKILDAHIK